MAKRLAALDIGTNTLLCLVVEVGADGSLNAMVDACRFGRLGQGVDRTGSLAPEAIERCLDICREFRALMDEHGVTAARAVGTQTLREVENAAAFREPAEEILGCAIEIIAGEREAELVNVAVTRSFPDKAAGTLVTVDVGGGSTEIIVAEDGAVVSFTSVPIGAVRLTERHLRSDPPTEAETQAMIRDIDTALAGLDLPTGVPVIGTAGTATTIAAVELRLFDYDPDAVQGLELSPTTVERQLARYLELEVAERKHLRGLPEQRADVIAAGVAIYARLLARVQAPTFTISDRGVRWGVAYELWTAV